jgi:hypothetical protein
MKYEFFGRLASQLVTQRLYCCKDSPMICIAGAGSGKTSAPAAFSI